MIETSFETAPIYESSITEERIKRISLADLPPPEEYPEMDFSSLVLPPPTDFDILPPPPITDEEIDHYLQNMDDIGPIPPPPPIDEYILKSESVLIRSLSNDVFLVDDDIELNQIISNQNTTDVHPALISNENHHETDASKQTIEQYEIQTLEKKNQIQENNLQKENDEKLALKKEIQNIFSAHKSIAQNKSILKNSLNASNTKVTPSIFSITQISDKLISQPPSNRQITKNISINHEDIVPKSTKPNTNSSALLNTSELPRLPKTPPLPISGDPNISPQRDLQANIFNNSASNITVGPTLQKHNKLPKIFETEDNFADNIFKKYEKKNQMSSALSTPNLLNQVTQSHHQQRMIVRTRTHSEDDILDISPDNFLETNPFRAELQRSYSQNIQRSNLTFSTVTNHFSSNDISTDHVKQVKIM